jgi:hypothetical protein
MAFTVEHQVVIPTNTLLRAKLTDLTVREVPKRDGGSFQRLNWTWEITQDGEYFGAEVRADTSAFLSDAPDNQFRNWAEALLQRPLDLGVALNENDLVGLQALITVMYEPDRKDPKKTWRRVEDVMALEGASRAYQDPPF